ncbi:unnamed protein product [Cercopithifilaria johnstoni]|uniref:Uncharacterized protein n=1 Tax=Cercopithifilaria johnstoni TaxID=2874296 RepID=A0A8J2LTD0_9BILA|nr:unnamed protein product [Cercopithifilaria johnstoni]
MHSLRMVVFLLTLMRNISITINYNRGVDDANRRIIDERLRSNIAKYHSNNTARSHDNIDNNLEDIKYINSYNKGSKEKSLREDMFKKLNGFEVSYPPAENRFFRSMLNEDLCNQYNLECIYYRSEYPHSRLSYDPKTDEEYNPCHRFVEPCFGISEYDYKIVKKFKSLRDY